MMTLTEFLLARIAEDEGQTFELFPYDCEPGCCAPEGWVGHCCLICDTPTSYGGTVVAIMEIAREHEESVHRHSRVLAECKAKRRIIERERWHPDLDECDGHPGSWMPHGDYGVGYCMWGRDHDGEDSATLRDLATIYADHPDYREEWKP